MLKGPTSTRLALLSDFFLVFLHRPLASCASQGASHSKASQPSPVKGWGWFVGGFSGEDLSRPKDTWCWNDGEKMGAEGLPCVLRKPAFIR